MTPRPSRSPTPAAATGPAGAAGDAEPPEQKRTLAVLVIAQVFSGAGLAAGTTVGALLAQDMLGATSLAGLPSALFTSARPQQPPASDASPTVPAAVRGWHSATSPAQWAVSASSSPPL